MSIPTRSEAERDAYEAEHGYHAEVACSECERRWTVRFYDGEPRDEADLDCECGWHGEPV